MHASYCCVAIFICSPKTTVSRDAASPSLSPLSLSAPLPPKVSEPWKEKPRTPLFGVESELRTFIVVMAANGKKGPRRIRGQRDAGIEVCKGARPSNLSVSDEK